MAVKALWANERSLRIPWRPEAAPFTLPTANPFDLERIAPELEHTATQPATGPPSVTPADSRTPPIFCWMVHKASPNSEGD